MMGDLSRLKVALWQREVREDSPKRSRQDIDAALKKAHAMGADCLITSAFPWDDAHGVIPCGASTAEYGTWGMELHAQCGDYDIGLGGPPFASDFSVRFSDDSWQPGAAQPMLGDTGGPSVKVGYVGIRNAGHAVRCYDGGSCVFDAGGRPLLSMRDDFEDDFALISFDEVGEVAPPCRYKTIRAISSSIRRFDRQVLGGSAPWIIGLSGGIDSSIVAALLVNALGNRRVIGYGLSTAHNSEATKGNARNLADALGIEYRQASIEDLVLATHGVIDAFGYPIGTLQGLALENAQARIRGHLLSTFASLEGGVVVNNGNFVESQLGYATLYGDSIGALAPIADLAKVDLFDLALEINELFGPDVIPMNLLPRLTDDGCEWDVAPSAELADGQRDPMKWFYHDWLLRQIQGDLDGGAIKVMRSYCQDGLESSGMGRWIRFYGLEDPAAFIEDLECVLKSVCRSAYKRIQVPPALLLKSSRLRIPQAEIQHAWEPSLDYLAAREGVLRLV